MMRWMAAILALAGCAPSPAPRTEPPVQGDTGVPGEPFPCSEAAVADLVGKPWTNALTDQVRDRSKARMVRVVRPGDAVTMDFSPERLNVQLDARDRIVEFRCG